MKARVMFIGIAVLAMAVSSAYGQNADLAFFSGTFEFKGREHAAQSVALLATTHPLQTGCTKYV
jgi:hypothetical protein